MASKRLARRYPVRNLSSREDVSGSVERLASIPFWTMGFDKSTCDSAKIEQELSQKSCLYFQQRFESEAGLEWKFSDILQWRLLPPGLDRLSRVECRLHRTRTGDAKS
jgi:hypothetical protein